MSGDASIIYRAEPEEARIIQPLDAMTLIYQRRSGITHIVAEPVPEILAAMGDDAITAQRLAVKLAESFDLGSEGDAIAVIAERLAELAGLGLVEQVSPPDA
ncbi:MAG: HPr-rel-A system PqqD family peptide chaperone [Sphingorhabdus sp.]